MSTASTRRWSDGSGSGPSFEKTLNHLLSLAIGMVVAPIVTIGLGVCIARAASGAPAPIDGR